ncbi:MAG: toxin-antitoxin system YwqK family antitoxin [Myxococcales bacterium]|nr:toxin-antitoxin system YwqK family antitoxin [Myxococcales bacterium]
MSGCAGFSHNIYYQGKQKRLTVEGKYRGIFHGKYQMWYESGQLMKQGEFFNGNLEGAHTVWHPNGKKWEQATYQAGHYHGPVTRWYQSGQLFQKASYVKGKKHGLFQWWDRYGNPLAREIYKNGKLIRSKIPFMANSILETFRPLTSGGLNREQVSSTLERSWAPVRTCYQDQMLQNHRVHGTIEYSWRVTAAGDVLFAKVSEKDGWTWSDSQVDSCILRVLLELKFPRSHNALATTVNYPFTFTYR